MGELIIKHLDDMFIKTEKSSSRSNPDVTKRFIIEHILNSLFWSMATSQGNVYASHVINGYDVPASKSGPTITVYKVKPVYNDHLMGYFSASAKGHLDELQKVDIVSKSKVVPSVFIKTHYWINYR